jgi:hypothetical protein
MSGIEKMRDKADKLLSDMRSVSDMASDVRAMVEELDRIVWSASINFGSEFAAARKGNGISGFVSERFKELGRLRRDAESRSGDASDERIWGTADAKRMWDAIGTCSGLDAEIDEALNNPSSIARAVEALSSAYQRSTEEVADLRVELNIEQERAKDRKVVIKSLRKENRTLRRSI